MFFSYDFFIEFILLLGVFFVHCVYWSPKEETYAVD